MTIFPCPPVWPAYLWGAIVGFALGLCVGLRWAGWRVYVTRHFNHSQVKGDGE